MTFRTLKELRSVDEKALREEWKNAVQYRSALYFERSQGTLKDTSQMKKTKAHVARIKTIERQRKDQKKNI